MAFCFNCGNQLATLSTEKFCSKCGQDLSDRTSSRRDSINISDNQGDVFGVGFSGTGNVIGKNIVVGSGSLNANQNEIQNIPNEYAKAITDFSNLVNEQLKGHQIAEDKVKAINNDLTELGKEVEDVRPGQEDKVDYVKKIQVEGKTASLVQKILDVLPEAAETASTFTPLAPFSKIIGKSIKSIVDAVSKK